MEPKLITFDFSERIGIWTAWFNGLITFKLGIIYFDRGSYLFKPIRVHPSMWIMAVINDKIQQLQLAYAKRLLPPTQRTKRTVSKRQGVAKGIC